MPDALLPSVLPCSRHPSTAWQWKLPRSGCHSYAARQRQMEIVPMSANRLRLLIASAMRGPLVLALALSVCLPFSAIHAFAQSGTQTQDSGFGPLDPAPPTGTTPQQIIDRFAAKESEFKQARARYGYRQTVKVQTVTDDGKVDGEYQQVTDISYNGEGARVENVVFAPQNTLERIMMSPADFSDIEHRLPFILTTEDLNQYDVTYAGRQKVDELDTYVFDAGPKVMEKNKRYFQGRVWVDQQDFQIVMVTGKNVPDDTRKGHEDLSPPFTTYREQIDGKYWFPTYTKAEGDLHFQGGRGYMSQDVHIREIVRYTNYKQFGSSVKIIYQGQDITNNKAPDAQNPAAQKPNAQTPATQTPAPIQPTSERPQTPSAPPK